MLRKIGGVMAGLIVAFLMVEAAELGVHMLYPPPAGTNMHDFAQVKKFVAALPIPAFVLVLAGWLAGTVVGTFVSARIGRSAIPAYVLGTLLFAAGIVNSVLIPQPVWFSAVSFVIYVGGAIVGARLASSAPQSALQPARPPA